MHQYASYLKSVYTSKKAPIYRWPQVKCKKYINLVLIQKDDITKPEAYQFMRDTIHGNIDDIKKSKRATDIPGCSVRRLRGCAGISCCRGVGTNYM